MTISKNDLKHGFHKDPTYGTLVFLSGAAGTAFAQVAQFKKEIRYENKIATLWDGITRATPVTQANIASAKQNPKAFFGSALQYQTERLAEQAKRPPRYYVAGTLKNASLPKNPIVLRTQELAKYSKILDSLDAENKPLNFKSFLKSPKTYRSGGLLLMAAGLALTAYQFKNAYTQDKTENGNIGRNTAQFAGSTVGGLIGGALCAPLTLAGSFLGGEIGARKGAEWATSLYDAKRPVFSKTRST